jgi:hypothetical protein
LFEKKSPFGLLAPPLKTFQKSSGSFEAALCPQKKTRHKKKILFMMAMATAARRKKKTHWSTCVKLAGALLCALVAYTVSLSHSILLMAYLNKDDEHTSSSFWLFDTADVIRVPAVAEVGETTQQPRKNVAAAGGMQAMIPIPPDMVLVSPPVAAAVENTNTDSKPKESNNNNDNNNDTTSHTYSNPSASSSSSSWNSRHVVVIHAGPHKTATTTIQGALMEQSLTGTLLADGYETLGQLHFSGCPPPINFDSKTDIKNHATLAFALQGRCPNSAAKGSNDTNIDSSTTPTAPPLALLQLSEFLSGAFSRNHSIILSSEEFDKPEANLTLLYDHLHSQLPDTNFRSIVILYYRRLLEWLPSIYFELHKKFQLEAGRPRMIGAAVFPSFVEWLNMTTLDQYLQLYPWAVQKRFNAAGFPVVKIVPMPSSKNKAVTTKTVQQFFCDHVPGANQTCLALSRASKAKKNQVLNRGTSMEYHRIMALAIQAGLIVRNKSAVAAAAASNRNEEQKGEVYTKEDVDAVQRLQAALLSRPKSYQKKYQTCLPKNVRTRLLELAMSFEAKMAPRRGNTNGYQLRFEFAALLESDKLCSWNAQRLLQEKDWKTFFRRS